MGSRKKAVKLEKKVAKKAVKKSAKRKKRARAKVAAVSPKPICFGDKQIDYTKCTLWLQPDPKGKARLRKMQPVQAELKSGKKLENVLIEKVEWKFLDDGVWAESGASSLRDLELMDKKAKLPRMIFLCYLGV